MARGFRLMGWGDAWLPGGDFGDGGPVVALGVGGGAFRGGGNNSKAFKNCWVIRPETAPLSRLATRKATGIYHVYY